MTFPERFEHLVAPALSAAIAAITLLQLIRLVFFMLLTCSLIPLEHDTFMPAFGMIMALLIPGIQACDHQSGIQAHT